MCEFLFFISSEILSSEKLATSSQIKVKLFHKDAKNTLWKNAWQINVENMDTKLIFAIIVKVFSFQKIFCTFILQNKNKNKHSNVGTVLFLNVFAWIDSVFWIWRLFPQNFITPSNVEPQQQHQGYQKNDKLQRREGGVSENHERPFFLLFFLFLSFSGIKIWSSVLPSFLLLLSIVKNQRFR